MMRGLKPRILFLLISYITMANNPSAKEHYHELEKPCRRVRIYFEGQLIAETYDAIVLKEVGRKIYDPTYYIPKSQIEMSQFILSDTKYKCPIKGEASYWHLKTAGYTHKKDIAWSYENPIEYSRPIEGCLAFDTRKVTIELSPYE